MSKQKQYESILTASEWWAGILRNGFKEKDVHPIYYILNQKPKLEERMIKNFQKELNNLLHKEIKVFGFISLYTTDEPKGLLATASQKAHIYYKLYNPFPNKLSMTLTKDSVLLRGKNGADTILYRSNNKTSAKEKE